MSDKVLTVGADPELFVKKNGKVSSFAGVLGYNKIKKFETGEGCRLQEDNVLLEFDIDPCTTLNQFEGLMSNSIAICDKVAEERGYELALGISSYNFTPKELDSFPKSVKEFGCSADMNALTGAFNPMPVPRQGLRTAGGHVHIGYTDLLKTDNPVEINQSKYRAGVLCDYIMGLPSLFEDKDSLRRSLYGAAGAIRIKEYGIEYRTLSNYWIQDHVSDVWKRVNKVVDLLLNGHCDQIFTMVPPEKVQLAINTNDKAMAEQYLRILESV
jgi:hypothetical protein